MNKLEEALEKLENCVANNKPSIIGHQQARAILDCIKQLKYGHRIERKEVRV